MTHNRKRISYNRERLQEGEQKYLMRWPELFRQGHGWGLL
jgi:hypothetical protein